MSRTGRSGSGGGVNVRRSSSGGGAKTITTDPMAVQVAVRKPAPKISSKLNPTKVSNPFSGNNTRFRTPFAHEHANGSLPAHIHHSGNTMTLKWSCRPDQVDEGRLLVLSSGGLLETSHPACFLAPAMFTDLITREGVGPRAAVPNLDKIVANLRAALSTTDRFSQALSACVDTSVAVGDALNRHLTTLLQPMAKQVGGKNREAVEDALARFEQNGGPEASKAIKAKIPTYTPMFRLGGNKPVPKRAAFT